MARASSAVRLRPENQSAGVQGKGMERAVSLPSLFPNGVRGSAADRLGPKKLPSELLFERKEFGVLQYPEALQKPKITGFLDLSQYSNYVSSIVPVDQPLFSVSPSVITFTDFEGLQTYEASLTLRNQDNVARRVKVYPPNSPFFDLAPGRGRGRSRKANGGSGGDKVAPGMEVSYVIRFKPDARIDYSHDLIVITEREKFSVPIRASGGSALLDFPDSIDFGSNCVVGHESEFTVLVRNIGDRATKFLLRCNPPFSISEPDGYLPQGASTQVDVRFKPERAQAYEGELHLKYGELEAVAMLYGASQNAEVSLSHSLLVIEDTYVGLETQGVVIIRNNSDVPVDFSWRLFQSVEEEENYRLQLQGQLKHEEREEMLFIQQAQVAEESSDESGSDEERLKIRREAKITSTLSRKYGNISKAVKEDPMLFHDATFSIEPLVGRVWSHSQLMCACSFRPKDALVYSCTAYLQCVGQEERAPLILKGLGIGPKASFSYDELDVNNVFVESAHRYEVQLLNQGDIEVDFRLVPKDSKFGSRFLFEPSSGRIAVGGVCEIIVNFKPKDLGPFHEVFDWVLKGSAIGVTLAFKGVSVRPTFEFDVDKINFGIVSYGFLNSRMLTLSNTAEVPMRYTLRILGDEEPPNSEFDIVPATGTLLPNCSQRVQVDFISMHEKKYDLVMAVDLEGVGEELHSIPVTAVCAAPQVTFEPHGCLSYGDVFIRYPFHQSLYLHNTSNLPAKFEVMAQEDKSRAEFEPDQWTGSVPPCASHVITVTLTAHMPGPVRVPMYVRILGRSVPFPLVLVANSIGPRVIVEPLSLDWGNVKCLEKVVRHVRLTNNSCIDASVRAFMNERKSLWSVHPKIIHLSPQETLQLAVTLKIDEANTSTDTLNLIVCESNPLTVQVRGKGIDTPVVTEDNLEHLDFGTLFTTHTEPKEIIIKNWGQNARRITWFREKDKNEKKGAAGKNQKDEGDKPPNIFRVEPENVVMEPKSAYRFTFLAMSPNPGFVEEVLVCNETLDKGGGPGKQIFKPRLTASFVAPQLRLSASELRFNFFWDRNKPIAPLTEPLTLENTGPLEVGFRVQVESPFDVDIEEGSIPPHGCQELQISFDPGYKADRKSSTVRKTLKVQYDEHPAVNTVECIGKVVWPNLELGDSKLDFGIILNETQKSMQVKMVNPTALVVSYHWCLAPAGRQADDLLNTRTTARISPPVTQGSGWQGANTSVSQATVSSASGFPGGGGAAEDALGGTVGPDGLPTGGAMMAAEPEMDVNQIFDILPIFGKIDPGKEHSATFTYYGLRDRTFKANAVCMVDGGPEYEVSLKGAAAPCLYRLDKNDLDFENIPFTELGEAYLALQNTGKVPAAYNFNVQGMSRQNVVEILPSSGIMNAGERLRVLIRFRAGIPDQVCETVLLEVAHYEPQRLTVKGNGTFPGIVIGLPRQNEEEHAQQLEEARRRVQSRMLGTGALPKAEGDERDSKTDRDEFSATMSSTTPAAGPTGAEGEGEEDAGEGVPSPRSAVSEETQSVATRRTGAARPTTEDLDLELEVDRHYLCEVLLRAPQGGGQTRSPDRTVSDMNSTQRMTMRGTTMSKSVQRKKEPPQVTAAYYYCDFGHIALGQTMKKQIGIFNCSLEPVVITIDKRTLREQGFLVEPENISKLPPRAMTNIYVSATRPREEEGIAELEWNLPVKGGPNYKIQLTADFVLPDLVLSTETIDFGRLLVGQRKRVTIELKNVKAVPVEWAYPQPRDRNQRVLTTNEVIFDLVPASGVLQPGESKFVVACFSPRASGQVNASLPLRIRDNQKRKIISVTGRGDILRLNVAPGFNYELGPVMPNHAGFTTDFKLLNPTDYPIEVYSVDFDAQYLEEERLLQEYDGYVSNFAEVSVRQPGDGTWKQVTQRVAQRRKERTRAEAIARGEEVEEEAEAAEEADASEEEQEEEDLSRYPWRVPQADRLNAVIVGPPKSGVSATARRLADVDLRKVIRIDDVITWACTEPRCLHGDWEARKIVAGIKADTQPTVGQVAHLLRLRTLLPDCNAGLIIDDTASTHLKPEEVVEAALEALCGSERLQVLAVRLPGIPGDDGSEATGPAAPSDAVEPVPNPAVEVITAHYEALLPAVAKYKEELQASVPQLEAAHKAAVEALEAAKAPTSAGADGAGAVSESELDVEKLAPLEKAVEHAAHALERAKSDITSCEETAAWTVADAAANFPPWEKPEVEEGAPEPEEPPPTVLVAEGYTKQFEAIQAIVEQYNTKSRTQEEDRLREIERRRRAKKAAAKEAAKPNRGRGKSPTAELASEPIVGPPPGMENWTDPAELIDLALEAPPYDAFWETCRTNFPLPLFPKEKPLPAPTVVQTISPPPERPELNPLPNFSILTPVPAGQDEATEGADAGEEGGDPPPEKTVATKTRWIVDPQSEQLLKIHFSAEEVNKYMTTLRFEVVGDKVNAPVVINVSGVSALPGIAKNPRLIFTRRIKNRPKGGYATKAFILEDQIYDFGPLLAGRDASERFPKPYPPPEDPEDGSTPSADPKAKPLGTTIAEPVDDTLAEPVEQPLQPVSPYVMRHAESLRITNDSLFPSNVKLSLASSGDGEGGEASSGPSPFIVDPPELLLGIGEVADVKVWCFPPEKGVFEDKFIAQIEHNPEPVTFGLSALGEIPWASLENEAVEFGRLRINVQAQMQQMRIKNTSTLPVKWALLCRDSKVEAINPDDAAALAAKAEEDAAAGIGPQVPEEFSIDAVEGKLNPGQDIFVRIGFRAARPAKFHFTLGLEVRDEEGFRDWQEAGQVSVTAETFAVNVVVEPDPRETALEFGTVLVGTSAERTFEVVNQGDYPVKYTLGFARKWLRDLFTIEAPEEELQPASHGAASRHEIKVTCTPGRQFDVPTDREGAWREGINLQIFDTGGDKPSNEAVEHKVPAFRVGVTAVYNSWYVTPPRGLNFGPVERGEKQSRTFVLRNIGIFAFDWCLFSPNDPPKYGPDLLPQVTAGELNVKPFTVKPTSSKLEKDEEITITVDFEAVGDEDFDSKVCLWVYGVQDEDGAATTTASKKASSGTQAIASAVAEGNPVIPTATYMLSGQSCVPGINTTDLQTVFEEQFFARTLEDAIAIAGRPDVRAFCEVDRIFNFGPVLAQGGENGATSLPGSPSGMSTQGGAEALEMGAGVTERFRLTNPKAIPCTVKIDVQPRGDPGAAAADPKAKDPKAKGAVAEEPVFRIRDEDAEFTIPAHDSHQIEVCFQPPRLANFVADIVATVVGGTDPQTNELKFELRGDGAVPSVSLQGPPLFGDEGGELQMGKLALGRSHAVSMTLRNDGLLPATARVDFTRSRHFTVTCPSSVHLTRGQTETFEVRFHPCAEGPQKSDFSIRTLGNPYEDVHIQLEGEGYSDDISWDLSEVKRPVVSPSDVRSAEQQAALPPAPDDLQLGEVAIGSETQVRFSLNNNGKQLLRFEMPELMPEPFKEQLKVEPSAAFIEPGSSTTITLFFKPDEKLEADKIPIVCECFNVVLKETSEPAEDGDGSPVDAGTAEDDGEEASAEPNFEEIEDTRTQVPLLVSATTDEHSIVNKLADGPRGERSDVTEIKFRPTVMFSSRLFRFLIENNSAIAAPCELKVLGENAAAFTVTPASCLVPANGDKEVEIRFSPQEVENFDCTLVRSVVGIPDSEATFAETFLTGTALRPWCHIELPASDYRSRRQSDTPLDPKYRIIEIHSLGTHVKNTKRFYVYNPTAEIINFEWVHLSANASEAGQTGGGSDDDSFRCLSKRGEIRPDKKFEMVFEYVPLNTETRESFWTFVLIGPKVEEHFLIVGTVEEPRIGMDSPAINFGERLLEGVTVEKVRLVNKEITPFSFSFSPASYQLEGQPQVLNVSPTSGVIGPDTTMEVEVAFKPLEERPFNFNVVCNVKRKKEPIVLNVKGIGYKIHASLTVEEMSAGRRTLNSGVLELLDFGVLQVQERRSFTLYLRNDSKRNFNYRVFMQTGPGRRQKAVTASKKPPYLDISYSDVAEHHEETPIEITYAPRDVHSLDGTLLQIAIPTGTAEETFQVQLMGGAKRSRLEFSFYSHDFGPCFTSRGGATMAGVPLSKSEELASESVMLVATNSDDTDCLLSLSSAYIRESWLDVVMDDTIIPPGANCKIPIHFSPGEVKEYAKKIEFVVSEYTRVNIDIRGRGCPLRLELTDIQMQNIDFGVTTGGEPISKNVRVINRSLRPVTFQLDDEKGQLQQRAVSWFPNGMTTLRPKDVIDVNLRFQPMYKIPSFRMPLIARCDNGNEVRLMHIAGTCHATEVRLSEHSVFFGDVVSKSKATRLVKLQNFGDLGAKFRFDVPGRVAGVYSISPSEGFVRPQEEIPLTLAFHPTLEKAEEFRKAERASLRKQGKKMSEDSKDVSITVRDIRCMLDGHPPLTLEATGRCISEPGEEQPLTFVTEVRKRVQNTFTINNETTEDWKVQPVVEQKEPVGANFWSCPSEVLVPAGKEVQVTVDYLPLVMTEPSEDSDVPLSPKSGTKRSAQHLGTIFIGTPDGKACLYKLVGTASPAKEADQQISAEVPCKKQHTQRVPVKNWLHERQRFNVEVELVDPPPDSPEAQGFRLHAVGTLDLPPGLERDYKFSIYAYHEGNAKVKVRFISQATGEFILAEVSLTFLEPQSLDTIHLEAACRQQTRQKILVTNPLDQVARFTGTSTNPDIRFSHDPLEVPPRSERGIDLLFRPVVEGSGQADVTLESAELGRYPYTVTWAASPAGRERTLVLKAPLGGSAVEAFKFVHWAQESVTYSAEVQPVESRSGPTTDFEIEPPGTVTANAAGDDGIEVSLGVRFQPSILGESRALLVVTGPKGGEYKALLTGFAMPPQPQGPIIVPNGKQGMVDFRNPFDKPTEFKFQIDNPAFTVAQRDMKMDPQQKIQVAVNFKSDRVQGGRLIISTPKVSTPWVFFLKGEL